MTTPVSAATPASAMKPTATATERLKPIPQTIHRPPVAFPALDRRRHDLRTKPRSNHRLNVADHKTVPGQLRSVRYDFKIVAAHNALGKSAGSARHALDGSF